MTLRTEACSGLASPVLPPSHPPLFRRGQHPALHAWDAEQKSQDCSHNSGYRIFVLPPVWLMPMLQRMTGEEEEAFWGGLDLEMGEELELWIPPQDIWIEYIGWQIQ